MKSELETDRDILKVKVDSQSQLITKISEKISEHQKAVHTTWTIRERMMQAVIKQEDDLLGMIHRGNSLLQNTINEGKENIEKAVSKGRKSRRSTSIDSTLATIFTMPALADCD